MSKTKWVLDTAHSEIQFRVKHMMISTVTGYFNKFDAQVETDGADFSTARIAFTADIDSISTNNAQRDAHLKSEDFFDQQNHGQLRFEGTGMQRIDDRHYTLHGNLTIRGISKPVVLNVEYGGTIRDPWGKERAGFQLDGKINRKDFNLHWNMLTEAGGFVAGEEVKIHAAVEFTKQPVEQAA